MCVCVFHVSKRNKYEYKKKLSEKVRNLTNKSDTMNLSVTFQQSIINLEFKWGHQLNDTVISDICITVFRRKRTRETRTTATQRTLCSTACSL
jgi:hypothetical protein